LKQLEIHLFEEEDLMKLKYVLIAIGPFLIFLLKTFPSSLPNDGGAGSGDKTGSIGGCLSLFVSLSNNRL
jgi:hypothetical protein